MSHPALLKVLRLLKRPGWLMALLIYAAFNRPVTAGPFEQGMVSLERGDFAEAYCLWRPLAMRGHAEAAYHVGWLYANGNGLKVDINQAIHWWNKAAAQDHVDAQFALGLAYTHGDGIKADPQQALVWYLRAANGGHEEAREIIRAKVLAGAAEVEALMPELVRKPWVGRPIRVRVNRANLRSGPGTGFKQIGVAEKGTVLKAVGARNEWYRVLGSVGDGGLSWIAGWLTEPVD
ncbi:MAG: SH3 domain-containing protein [Gammaproteobacteria bacterium]|nr:SH3 domain-containing protein [Gammaproteobacteria bacterium]